MNRFLGNKLAIFLFAFPTLFLFTAFVFFPIIPAMITSLQKHDGFAAQGFVGLQNYIDVLSSQTFWHSNLNNGIIMLFTIGVGLPISLFLALLINYRPEGIRRFFKTTSFMPAVISVTVICQMWVAILEPQWGLLNTILKGLGLEGLTHEWLSDEKTVMLTITFVIVWQYIGFNMVLFYTGIKSISPTYYEAALIDGANFIQSSIRITIPLLQEVIKFMLIASTISSMGLFAHVRVMSNGGPGDFSRTVIYQLYYTAFSVSEFGKGCAISIIFIIECLLITIIINSTIAKQKIEF